MTSAGSGVFSAIVKGYFITFALFLLYTTIPFLGAVACFFVPFPCIYYSLKCGRVAGYAIFLLLVLSLAILNQHSLLPYLILAATSSLALPEFLSRGKGVARAFFLTIGLNTLVAAGFAVIVVGVLNIDLDEQLRQIIHGSIQQVGETYRQSGLSGKELQALTDGLQALERSFVILYPSLVIILFGVVAGLNLLALKRVAGSLGKNISFESFSRYRNPDSLVWLLIVAGFSLLADIPVITSIALNILFVVYFLYTVQGLAIYSWLSKKKNFPRLLQISFYVVLAVQPLLTVILAVLGLSDLWACFRSPKTKENL